MPDLNVPTHILVVDDSPESLTMLTDALSMEGMDVEVATSGRQAFGLVENRIPDLVLMDAMMPGIDGFETCRVLKSEKGCEDVPVIFMTGFRESEHVVRALASGGVDFVAKPVILDQLFARIRVHLANARRARSARKALDSTGRRIVACDPSGAILWATPQAGELMRYAGLRCDEAARLPWEIVDHLFGDHSDAGGSGLPGVFRFSRNGAEIEFRLLDEGEGVEKLIRLIDGQKGSDEEQLATAFNLTFREAEVLLWVTHGKSNKEIAEILDMSPRTVNKHLEQIFVKLAVENRTAAATMSVRVLWRD
jgi:DNA-binding response OmpR family regulator/DNA-binding CsgD family transcriptional regulator|tara:strand:+ start:59065 stop:59988 length:924 start_codon:yes stop_codon:yes gene_type:complete